jgi:hypothetical protein
MEAPAEKAARAGKSSFPDLYPVLAVFQLWRKAAMADLAAMVIRSWESAGSVVPGVLEEKAAMAVMLGR